MPFQHSYALNRAIQAVLVLSSSGVGSYGKHL